MSRHSDSVKGKAERSDDEFFTVGPPLHAVRSGYIVRPADAELYDFIVGGNDVYIFAPMRSGKTSLIAAASARLRNNGFLVANLDLAQIGERDAGSDAGRWYYSIAYRLLRQLRIKIDLQEWWQDKAILTSRQRLFEFYIEVLLANTRDPVVVFIDELQTVEDLEIAQHLVESITAVNKARVTEPEFGRLTFVLSGECDAALIVPNPELSPFSMMRPVRPANFSREALKSFASELNLDSDRARRALDRIHYWTRGQPYLTQKLARMVARDDPGDDVEKGVDRIVRQSFGGPGSRRNDAHLAHIHNRILADSKHFEACLTICGRLGKGIKVDYDPESRPQRLLMSVGLVIANADGDLEIASPLYKLAFTARWANENLPLRWRGPAAAAAVLSLLIAVPFWYTQLLPRPYIRILTSSTTDIETAADAYGNLRSFPGHHDAADRLFVSFIRTRASMAASEGEVARIAAFTDALPADAELANELIAGYWDRRASRLLRLEDRDRALLAALQSLVNPTPERRRLAGSLIGEDYPLLIGGVGGVVPQRRAFDAINQVLTYADGPRIHQWTVRPGRLEARGAWSASALEIAPLLRRVVVDRAGTVRQIGLTVNVSHARLDDLRIRLIAPSGRAAELEFEEPRSTTAQRTRFAPDSLADLQGESIAGTWTLSIRDEAMDIAGHLIGWDLTLNSQVLEESFERGLDIPEPVERLSDNLWLSADGRFAIARAEQSDSARLWNLVYASPTRTLAVPASEQVLGITANAEHLVTRDEDAVHVWNTDRGSRRRSIDIGEAQEVRLLSRGRRLLLRRSSDAAARFDVLDIDTGRRVSRQETGGSVALWSVDAGGTTIAVADYDRAVRLWDLAAGSVIAQFDLPVQPSAIELAPDGRSLAVRHAGQGFSLWRTDRPAMPVLARFDDAEWSIVFSATGDRLLAGNTRVGYQIYRTDDGRAVGPALDAGSRTELADLLAFSDDGNVLLTAMPAGNARIWRFPTAASALAPRSPRDASDGRWWWREADLVATLAPDGQRIAVGDSDGHVHIFTESSPPDISQQDLGFLGHRRAVSKLTFSDDSRLVASIGTDRTIRVWDALTGLPKEYVASHPPGVVDELRFAPSNRYLAALSGRQLWILDIETGRFAAELDLGEAHNDIAFAEGNMIYLASSSGTLSQLAMDRMGNWTQRKVWHGPHPLQRVRVGSRRGIMIVVDDRNVAQVLDPEAGSLAPTRLDLPDRVTDILFTANDSQALFRTSRWVHHVVISGNGLHWQSAVRIPEVLAGSALVAESPVVRESGVPAATPGLLLLTRDAGFAEVAELDFAHATGNPVVGNREALLETWSQRLGLDFRSSAAP